MQTASPTKDEFAKLMMDRIRQAGERGTSRRRSVTNVRHLVATAVDPRAYGTAICPLCQLGRGLSSDRSGCPPFPGSARPLRLLAV
jgi:hypothetical protein